MKLSYKGPANQSAIAPLLTLASLENAVGRCERPEGFPFGIVHELTGFRLDAPECGALIVTPEDRCVGIAFGDDAASVESPLWVRIWGDTESPSYWWSLAPILFQECISPDGAMIDLSETTRRLRELLGRVTFFQDEAAVIAGNDRAITAMNYLRMLSQVTESWIVSLAAPFEVRLEDDNIGECDGLIYRFDQLPPGLNDLGECALIELEEGPERSLCVRPVMYVFDDPCTFSPMALQAARNRLKLLGFGDKEVRHLDAIARKVAAAYQGDLDVA